MNGSALPSTNGRARPIRRLPTVKTKPGRPIARNKKPSRTASAASTRCDMRGRGGGANEPAGARGGAGGKKKPQGLAGRGGGREVRGDPHGAARRRGGGGGSIHDRRPGADRAPHRRTGRESKRRTPSRRPGKF